MGFDKRYDPSSNFHQYHDVGLIARFKDSAVSNAYFAGTSLDLGSTSHGGPGRGEVSLVLPLF